MAEEVEIRRIDDLEKKQTGQRILASQTIEFTVNGNRYRIDLSDDNAAKLMRALAPFMEAAEQVVPRRGGGKKKGNSAPAAEKTTTKAKPRMDRERTDAIRLWARQNSFSVSDRGRIPTEVLNAYEANGSPTLSQLQGEAPEAVDSQYQTPAYAG